MLELIKLDLGIVTNDFDIVLQMYIDDCVAELEGIGVTNIRHTNPDGFLVYDPQAAGAIIAYCKWKFRNNEDKADFERIYNHKVEILKVMSGHTDWEA